MDTLKKSTALFEEAKTFLTTSLDRISLSFSSISTDVENVDKSSQDLDIFNQAATEIESLKPKLKELEAIGADLLSTLEVLGCQDTAKGKDLKQSLSSLPSRLTNLSQLATQNRKKLSDAILQSLHESVIKKKEALTCLMKDKISLDGGVFISQIQSHGRLIADIEKLNSRISEIVIKCTHTEKNECQDIQNDSAALEQISQNHKELLESIKKGLDDINSIETWMNTFEQSLPKEVGNHKSCVPDVRNRYEEGVEKMKSLDQLLRTLGKHSECRDQDKLSQRIANINDVWANSRKRALSILEKAVSEDKLTSTVKQVPVRASEKDWSRLTVVELKRELSKRKLSTTGRKAELVLRIKEHQRETVRHTSNEEAKELPDSVSESETAENNLTGAASNILDKTEEPQKMVKLKEDIPEENIKFQSEESHQEISDKKSSIHTEEDQISKTGKLDDKSTERCQNNKSTPEKSPNVQITKGRKIIETETESVPISREEHRDPPGEDIPYEIPDLVIDLGEDNSIVTRNTASNKEAPYDPNKGKEMDHDGEKPVVSDQESLVYPDTGMTLVIDKECPMVPDVETTEVETTVVQDSKTTAVPDIETTVVQDGRTKGGPDVKTTVDPDVQTTVIQDGKIKRAPKVKTKVVPDEETKVTPNIKTTVAQNRKTIVDPDEKNTVVLDGKTTVAANIKTAVVPDVKTPVAPSGKIPSCRPGMGISNDPGRGRDMLLGLEEAWKFENPSGFEKRAERVERLVTTSKPDNLTLVVYPITLEDYAHPIILEAACKCYSLNSVHHNIAEDMYAEPVLVGLLHLHFKMEADLLTYAIKLKSIKDDIEVYQASETPGLFKSFNKKYLPPFMEKPAVLLRGSLPFFIEEDDLWEVFPRAHRVCILQSDPDPKSRLGGRHGNVMFASNDALQKNLDWLDSHKPRDALSTLKFYNFTEVAKVMRAPQAKGSAAEPPSPQISTPTSVTRSLLKAKPDPPIKSQSSAANRKPPPHPASKPVTNPSVNQSLNPTQPLGQSMPAPSKATGKTASNTDSKAASKAVTKDDSKGPNNTDSKNASKAATKDAINDTSKDASKAANKDACKADSKDASKADSTTPTSVSGGLTGTRVSGQPLSIFDGVANQEQEVKTPADAGLKTTPLSKVLLEPTPADMDPDKNIYDDISDEDFDVGGDNGPSGDEDVQIHKKQYAANKRPATVEPIVTQARKRERDGKDYKDEKRLKQDDSISQKEVTKHIKYDDATAESRRTFNDRREVLRTLFIHNIVQQVFNESEFKAWVTKSLRQLGYPDVKDPIIEIRFGSPHKGFGFVEFRDEDLATKALELNNLRFQGRYVRLARPRGYAKYAKQHANQDQTSINEEKRNVKREKGTREHHYSNKDSSAKSEELHSRRQRWRHLWKKAILKVLIVIQMEKKNQSLQDAVLTGGSDVDMRLPKAAKAGDIPDYIPSGGTDVDMRLVEAASAGGIPDAVPYGGSDVDMRLLEAAKAGRIPDAVPSDVDMRLLEATKAGDIPNAILSDGFDVDTRLLDAAKAGDIDIIEKIVSTHPRSLNCRDGRFSTPLHLASGYNRLAVVEFLLKSGANVQAEDKGGMVPLHNACSHGHYEVTQLLIDHGACINAVDLWKFTPLHEAASKGKLEICKLLLKHGADVNKKTIPDDHTPLDLVREGDKDVADLIRAEIAKQSRKEPVDTRVKVKPRTILEEPEISDLTAESLTLRWKASDIPLYALPTPIWYIVEQREPPSLEWVKIVTDTKETELPSVRINRNKDYYWHVRAANEFGISEPSRPVMLKKKEVAYDTTVKVSDKQASAGKPVATPTRKREHDNAENKDELSLKQDGGIRKKQKSKRIKSDNARTPNTNLHRKKVVLQTLFVYNIRPQFQEDKFKAWVSYSLKQLGHSDVEDPIIDITFGSVHRKFILVMFRTEDLATKALKLNGRCFQGVCLLVERHKEYAGFVNSDQTSTNEEKTNVEREKASTITTDSTANQIPTVVRQRKQEDGKSDAATSSVVTKTISQARQVQPLTELATPLQSGISPQGLPPPTGMPPPSLANNPVQPLHPSPQTKAPRQQVQTKHEASSATPTVQTQASEMRQQVQAKIQTSVALSTVQTRASESRQQVQAKLQAGSPIPLAQTQTSASSQTVQAKHQASSATTKVPTPASETKQQGQTGAPRQEGQTKPQAIEVTPLGRKLEVKSSASEKPVPTKYQASNIIPLVQTQDSASGQQVQTVPQAIEVTPLGRNPKVKSSTSGKQVKTPYQASNVISLVQIEDSSPGQEVKIPYQATCPDPLGQHLQVQPSASEQLVPTQYQASNVTPLQRMSPLPRMPPPWFNKNPVQVTYPPPQPSTLGQQMQMQYQASTASTLVQSQTSATEQLAQMPYQGINVPPQALVQTPSASGQTPYQAINVHPPVHTSTSASGYTPYQAMNAPPPAQVLTQTSAPGQTPYQASYCPPPAAQVPTQPPSQAYQQYQPSQMTSQWQTPYQAVSQAALPADQKQFFKAPLPQPSKYVYDAASGYHYDPTSNLYYDERTQRFYSTVSLQFWVYDYKKETYIPAPNQEFPPHGMPSTTPSIPPPYGTLLTTQAKSLPYGTAPITTAKPDEQATYNWSTFKPKGHDKGGSIHHRRHDRTWRKYSSAQDDCRSSATSISSDSSFSDDDWRKDRSRSPDSRGSKKYRSTKRGRASREYRRRGDRSRSPVSRSPEDSRPRDWERSSHRTEPGTTSTAVARPRDESSLIPAGASSLQILSLMARSSLQLRNSRRSDVSPLRERSRRSDDSPPRGRFRMSDGSLPHERSRRSDFSPLSERSRSDFSPPSERLRRRSIDSPPRGRLRRSIDSPPRERSPNDSYHKRLSDDSYIRDSSRIVRRDEFPSSSDLSSLSHGGKSLRRPPDMVTSLAGDQRYKRSIEEIPQERPGPSGLSADDLRLFLHNRDDRPAPDRDSGRPYRDVRLVPKRPDSDRKRSGSFSRDKMPKSPDSEDSCRESESELLQQYQFLKESLKNLSRHIPKSDRDKLLQESRDLDDISD